MLLGEQVMEEVRLDKRTREYRDSHVDYEVCSEDGCESALPPLESGQLRTKPEPCQVCIWKNA